MTVAATTIVAEPKTPAVSVRGAALAARLETGVDALAALAASLSDAEWTTPVSATDRRPVGVIVHHVGNMFPLEMQLSMAVASGTPIQDVTWDAVASVNAGHAKDTPAPTKAEAVALLRKNGAEAAAAIRALSDAQLDTAVANSLYGNAPLTCQFFLEDHPVRHSYHHAAKIRAALKR